MEGIADFTRSQRHELLRVDPKLANAARLTENGDQGMPGKFRLLLQEGDDVGQDCRPLHHPRVGLKDTVGVDAGMGEVHIYPCRHQGQGLDLFHRL